MPSDLNLRLVFHQAWASKKIPKNILEIRRPFIPQHTGKWLWNLWGINFLKLHSKGFMMLALMGGMHQISIGTAIIRDGAWQSFKQLKAGSLAASQKLNGTSLHHHRQYLNQTPHHSCSAWIWAANILSQRGTLRLFHAIVIYAQHLAKMASKT